MNCTLCTAPSPLFCEDKKRTYFRCPECDLIFANPETHLPQEDEKAIYDFHQNGPQDIRYREFLSQLSMPLLEKLSTGMTGLDFGSGPGPTLSLMLEEQGMRMSIYDIYYAPDSGQLSRQYDFVTCSEVVEHFSEPAKAWPQLISLVKPKGYIGVMTWMFTKKTAEQFNQWRYKGDPTHVSFYTPKTMQWIGQHFQLSLEIISEQVILLRKD
jgi:hypothetical protein